VPSVKAEESRADLTRRPPAWAVSDAVVYPRAGEARRTELRSRVVFLSMLKGARRTGCTNWSRGQARASWPAAPRPSARAA